MRKLKRSFREEPYEEWKERNQDKLEQQPHQPIKQRPWYLHPIFLIICSVCVVFAILVPVFVFHRDSVVPEFGETDVVFKLCDEEVFTTVSGVTLEGIQNVEYREGKIDGTQEQCLVTASGTYETADIYAELMLTTVILPNLKLSNQSLYEQCDQPCVIGDYVFHYMLASEDSIYKTYLAYAETDEKRYYVEIRTLWEIDLEAFLRTIFQ